MTAEHAEKRPDEAALLVHADGRRLGTYEPSRPGEIAQLIIVGLEEPAHGPRQPAS